MNSCASFGKRQKISKKQPLILKTKISEEVGSVVLFPSQNQSASSMRTRLKSDAWGTSVPVEILHKIFSLVVRSHGSIPFLVRMQRVCRHWYTVASDPGLWTHVDLSYGWISKDVCKVSSLLMKLEFVEVLDFSGWSSVDEPLQIVSSRCDRLRQLNLTACSKISMAGLRPVIDAAKCLTSINLSKLSSYSPHKSDITDGKHLSYLIKRHGRHLERLIITQNRLAAFNPVMENIVEMCASLQEVDLSENLFSQHYLRLPVEALQRGCPLLRVLRLNGSLFLPTKDSAHETSNGFVFLEELHLASESSVGNMHEPQPSTIRRLLWNSSKLRLLDLTGTERPLCDTLIEHVPLTSLEVLYLARSASAKETNLPQILAACCDSLKVLDVSWNGMNDVFNAAVTSTLAMRPDTSRLHTVDLTGNAVSAASVSDLILGCPQLTTLNLTSCRNLPRGVKRLYASRADVMQLHMALKD